MVGRLWGGECGLLVKEGTLYSTLLYPTQRGAVLMLSLRH